MLKCEKVSVNGIIRDVSFEAKRGKFTAILGKNGSGKTTLAKCIMAEQKFNGGITLDGIAINDIPSRERAKLVAYLPQSLPSPNITVFELVSLGRNPHINLYGKMNEADITAVQNAIRDTDMLDFSNRMLPTLSGGEKQRAYLAMMLTQDADILLLDEPTAHMDMAAAAEFAELLSTLNKTLIVIMHDLTLAVKHADNMLILDGGKQVFFGSKKACIDSQIIEETFKVSRIENNGENIFLI